MLSNTEMIEKIRGIALVRLDEVAKILGVRDTDKYKWARAVLEQDKRPERLIRLLRFLSQYSSETHILVEKEYLDWEDPKSFAETFCIMRLNFRYGENSKWSKPIAVYLDEDGEVKWVLR